MARVEVSGFYEGDLGKDPIMTTTTLNMKLLARTALGAGSALAISAALSMGCNSDDSAPADSGAAANDSGDAGSLYTRLGGHAGIRAARPYPNQECA